MPESTLADEATEVLRSLCEQFPLGYVPEIRWRAMRVSAGLAHYLHKRIVLSSRLLTDSERMRSTLTHEYAHLLAVARHGTAAANHGQGWRQAMIDLGQSPEVRHNYPVERIPGKLIYFCSKCGKEVRRHRRLKRGYVYTHRDCGGKLKWKGMDS